MRARLLSLAPLVILAGVAGCWREPPPAAPWRGAAGQADAAADAPRVKLAVLVVFDQMRGDYPDRWAPLYGPDGFNRLKSEGADFRECHYPYALTTTGPGHASILSGTSAERHGIINNGWYDRKAGKDAYCATTERYRTVPANPLASVGDTAKKAPAGATPDRMLSPTLADSLKEATRGAGKVVAVSLKDRGAVLPAGRKPDACYWFDDRLSTSTYYRDSVAPWVKAFNDSKKADEWFGFDWVRLRDDVDYDRWAGPDDVAAEGGGVKQGKLFPHKMTGGLERPGSTYYGALENSPFGNDLLLEIAKLAVDAEQLGRDETPDLLSVSFSSNDLIGHTWGPDSHEVLDVTLRTDVLIAELLRFLDEKVGRDQYALVMTADHGVCPLPEVSSLEGIEGAVRIPVKEELAALEKYLAKRFPDRDGTPPAAVAAAGGTVKVPRWLEATPLPHLYVNDRLLKRAGTTRPAVAKAAAEWLAGRPGIAAAFTRDEILAKPATAADTGELINKVRKCYHPDRGGDVVVFPKPYCLFDNYATGTSHGTPWPYDTHVPLFVFGPGVAPGRRSEPARPQQAASILAEFLGVPPPRDNEYGPPVTLWEE